MKKTLSVIAKKMDKGGLHKSLGIPQGQKIPTPKIKAAENAPGKLGKQARLAETFAKHRPKKL